MTLEFHDSMTTHEGRKTRMEKMADYIDDLGIEMPGECEYDWCKEERVHISS